MIQTIKSIDATQRKGRHQMNKVSGSKNLPLVERLADGSIEELGLNQQQMAVAAPASQYTLIEEGPRRPAQGTALRRTGQRKRRPNGCRPSEERKAMLNLPDPQYCAIH